MEVNEAAVQSSLLIALRYDGEGYLWMYCIKDGPRLAAQRSEDQFEILPASVAAEYSDWMPGMAGPDDEPVKVGRA